MKALRFIRILYMVFVAVSLYSCKGNPDELSGITGMSWQKGIPLEITPGKELSVSFHANDNWTATSDSKWCNLLDDSGKSGKSTLRLLVTTPTTASRMATVTIQVSGYPSESFQVVYNETTSSSEDMEVNAQVDQYLREMYLWNDEYKTLKLDFTKSYDKFLYDALGSMTTNVLDKKYISPSEYTLFSYIQKKTPIPALRSTPRVKKELEYSFGITGLTPVFLVGDVYNFFIQGVYPNSPAAKAGLKRGTIITQINGEKMPYDIANRYFGILHSPSSPQTLQITDYENKQTTITAEAMYVNPVVFKQVREIHGRRIGYLVYAGFDAAYDDELFDAFQYFKNQNITDLILDLRYNGGGHTMSANLISSCIAGSSASNKIFVKFRYNESRMQAQGQKLDEEKFMYSNYPNLSSSLAAGDLGLSRVYCLVGNGTASASELVINSLRGIDLEVILIGEQTTGKNVGMEPVDLKVRGNTYFLVPITFQSYNAKDFGAYEKGFTPNKIINEIQPYGEGNIFYPHREYGTNEEFLYAAAVEAITGVPLQPKTRNTGNFARKGKGQKMHLPTRPGQNDMIKIPLE